MLNKEGEPCEDEESVEDSSMQKKYSLRKKLDIPVEHLDFSYIRKCTKIRELEKILKILRSGEEGHFPELIACVEQRIKGMDPSNRLLRIELPALRASDLATEERESIFKDISEWVHTISSTKVCDEDSHMVVGDPSFLHDDIPPIRGQKKDHNNKNSDINGGGDAPSTRTTPSSSIQPRIKSWEYEKWDKFDAEEELNRMEVVDMQIAEWEKVNKPKIQVEQKRVEKLMKDTSEQIKTKPTSPVSQLEDVGSPSFIEEISEPYCTPKTQEVAKLNTSAIQPHRRVRIQIEDVNIPF